MGIHFLVHAFGMEYVRLKCGGIRSINERMTNEANFRSFMNTRLTAQLFWYWDDDTLNDLVNDPIFQQSIHYETIYSYAENRLKVWLKNILDINALALPTSEHSRYKVPTCTIECEAVVGELIYNCEFKMLGSFDPNSMANPIDFTNHDVNVTTEWVTEDNQFWIENYDIAPESLSSKTSTFQTFSSIFVETLHPDYMQRDVKLNLDRIPRTVRSFESIYYWMSVVTSDHSSDSKHGTLLLADLPPRIETFTLDGADEFHGTISFDDLPISTRNVSFDYSEVSGISVTKKFDIRSQLRYVLVLSPNLSGYLDLQLLQCFRRKIGTIFEFDGDLEDFTVKNDRHYYCKLERF